MLLALAIVLLVFPPRYSVVARYTFFRSSQKRAAAKTRARNGVFLFDTIDILFKLHVSKFTDYFLICSKIFCEDFGGVTYSVPEKYIIEFGGKIKETGKKDTFTCMCFGTNNDQNYEPITMKFIIHALNRMSNRPAKYHLRT